MVIARRLAAILTFSISLTGVAQERLTANKSNDDHQKPWRVLAGPEQENGKPIEIATNSPAAVKLLVEDRRGTAIQSLSPQPLPAIVTFKLESEFDPQAVEPPTQLFGTGDFRIFIGSSGHSPDDLGAYEGFQLRIFPHLGVSENRRKTGEESHTATSLWIRNIDVQRRTNSDGEPHSGLLSDACQNRSTKKQRHNCGWSRVLLTSEGFGLKNRESTFVSVVITRKQIEIVAGHWHHKHDLRPSELRISTIDSFAIGHTNISRGYKSVTISDLTIEPFEQPSEITR
jgi:hypothetical protein